MHPTSFGGVTSPDEENQVSCSSMEEPTPSNPISSSSGGGNASWVSLEHIHPPVLIIPVGDPSKLALGQWRTSIPKAVRPPQRASEPAR